jgi:hypothetical protein
MPSLMVYVSNDVYSALLESGKREEKTPNKKAGEIITTWFNQIPGVK